MKPVPDKQNLLTCETQELEEIVFEAAKRDYNRQLTAEIVPDLDADGVHVFQPFMVHEHANGQEVEPHMRGRAYVKLRGQPKPVEAWLDVPMEFIPAAPEVIDATRRGRAA